MPHGLYHAASESLTSIYNLQPTNSKMIVRVGTEWSGWDYNDVIQLAWNWDVDANEWYLGAQNCAVWQFDDPLIITDYGSSGQSDSRKAVMTFPIAYTRLWMRNVGQVSELELSGSWTVGAITSAFDLEALSWPEAESFPPDLVGHTWAKSYTERVDLDTFTTPDSGYMHLLCGAPGRNMNSQLPISYSYRTASISLPSDTTIHGAFVYADSIDSDPMTSAAWSSLNVAESTFALWMGTLRTPTLYIRLP